MATNICPKPAKTLQAVRHILTALPYGSVAAFYQTDVRLPTEGQVSKAFLVLKAAEDVPEAGGCVVNRCVGLLVGRDFPKISPSMTWRIISPFMNHSEGVPQPQLGDLRLTNHGY